MAAQFVSCRDRAHSLVFYISCGAGMLIALQTLAFENSSAVTQSSDGNIQDDAGKVAALGSHASPIADKGGQVDVKTYGAVGDGVTDDTAAFDAALKAVSDAGGGRCLVPKGIYLISGSGITSRINSGVHLIGEGHSSMLKIAAMPTGALIVGEGNNWSIENLTLDMQDYSPSRICPAIRCRGDNWRVANCSILKIGRIGITVIGGNNWSIEKNHITKTTPAQTLNQSILVTKYQDTRASNARIIDNTCEGSGILFWGFNSTIARNQITNVGFGSGICTGQAANCRAMKVIGNSCTGGRGFDKNRTWVSGFELWAPNSVIAGNTAYDNDGTGIIVGGQNCIIVGNYSSNNGAHPVRFGFGARYANPVDNASGSVFIGNRADDTRYPSRNATQAYGYSEQPGGLHNITHIGNDYNRNRIRPAKYNSTAGQRDVSMDQGSRVVQTRLSPETRNRLKALAQDGDLPDNARQLLHQCLRE